MTTDTTELGLERLICTALAGHPCDPPAEGTVADPPAGYGGVGWSGASFHNYDREHCVDLVHLAAFLHDTQPEASAALALSEDGPTRRAFLTRLQGEVAKRGTIDVLRNGIKHGPLHLDLFYGTPSEHNLRAQERFAQNRFTVTRQLRYSRDEAQRALDIGLFINGLPVFTFELKNSLHQADGGRRGVAVPAGSQSAREAVRVRALHRALRGGRARGAVLHPPHGKGVVVPAVQPRLERRRGQPAEPGRAGDRLPVARGAAAGERDQHPGELCPGGGGEGRQDRQEAAGAGLAALPPTRRGAPPAGRRRSSRGWAGAT